MENDDLIEAKATGEDSVAADPVVGAGGEVKKRKADKELKAGEKADNVEDHVKTPQGTNNAGLHEAVKGLFEGEELSEEFKEKAAVVFEAAVNETVDARVAAIVEAKDAEYEEKLAEAITSFETELSETVEQFMEFTSKKWLEENAVAIESGLKVELAESLLDGLKSLFVEHNVVVDESKVDTIEEMANELESVSKKFTDSVKANADLSEQIVALKNELAFVEISEGLAATQVEKLRALSENVSFVSTEDYASKVKALRESFFTETAVVAESDATENLQEEVAAVTGPVANPEMLSLAEALNRFSK